MKKIAGLLFCLILLYAGCSYGGLAFVANVDGNWDLFTVEEDGRELVRLTATPYDEKDPTWSADRNKVVYASIDGQLSLVDVKTKEAFPLAIEPEALPTGMPAWSPNLQEITFAQLVKGAKDLTELIVFDLRAKTTRRLLDQPGAQASFHRGMNHG